VVFSAPPEMLEIQPRGSCSLIEDIDLMEIESPRKRERSSIRRVDGDGCEMGSRVLVVVFY
jgi:hypothetical protein